MSFFNKEISEQEFVAIMEKIEAEEQEAQKNGCNEDPAEENLVLTLLQDELHGLLEEMMELNSKEAGCIWPETGKRWNARRDLLKEQIKMVEEEITELGEVVMIEE